jgi:hypothetical protein
MRTLALLLSIVVFDACQTCRGVGWYLAFWWGPLCVPECCPHCKGTKVLPVPPNNPPPDDEWELEA